MNYSPDHSWLAILLSLAAFGLLAWHLPRCVVAYRRFHDARAAVALATAISSAVIALGLLIAALGLLIHDAAINMTGHALARGAILTLAAVLVFADVREAP